LIVVPENGTTGDISTTNGQLLDYSFYLYKEGRAESTIKSRVQILKSLVKAGASLMDPESVKLALAQINWVPKRKVNAVDAYDIFVKRYGLTWAPPRYRVPRNNPFVPTEKEIDALIAGTGSRTSTLLLFLKETGVRIGEAQNLKWVDIDVERRLVNVTPEKGSNPRTIPISDVLLVKLHGMKTNKSANPERVFTTDKPSLYRVFHKQRRKMAEKLQNPRLMKVTFHSIRHWHGTIFCMLHGFGPTQERLGHRSPINTEKYVHLAQIYFKDAQVTYDCREAVTVDQAKDLIAKGYEYVTEIDRMKLFRKKELI
jgi:integrase